MLRLLLSDFTMGKGDLTTFASDLSIRPTDPIPTSFIIQEIAGLRNVMFTYLYPITNDGGETEGWRYISGNSNVEMFATIWND